MIHSVQPDANCFFKGLAMILYYTEKSHQLVRDNISSIYKKNLKLFSETDSFDSEDEVLKRAEEVQKLGVPIQECDFMAIAQAYDIDLLIISRT